MGKHWRDSFRELETLSKRNGVIITKVEHKREKYILVKRTIPCVGSSRLLSAVTLVQTLQKLKSDRLVSIYGFDVDEERIKYTTFKEVDVYMKYMEKGSFDKIYKKLGPIPIDIVGEVALAVVEAASYLYDEHHVVPRCIKPSNILLSAHGTIRLCDYGMPTEVMDSQPDSWVRTSYYISPERVKPEGHEVDPIKGDMWALGITLIELALGRFPYGRITPTEVDWIADESASSATDGTLEDLKMDSSSLSLSPAQPSPDFPSSPKQKPHPVEPGEKASRGPSWAKQGVSWNAEEGTMGIIDLLKAIVWSDPPGLPEGCFSQETERFVDGCLEKEPEKRMAPKELLGHAWLTAVREKAVDVRSWANTI